VAAAPAGDADPAAEAAIRRATHRAIEGVTAAVEGFRFNAAVAGLMTLQGAATRTVRETPGSPAAAEAAETLVVLLAPFAPHLADELWTRALGREGRATAAAWPQADPALAAGPAQRLAVQVDGRVRAQVELPAGAGDDEIRAAALTHPAVVRHLDGRPVERVIVVPGRLVSLVSRA
jgi:leucyl-tRNA synthetase